MPDNSENMFDKIKNNTEEENRALAAKLHSNLNSEQIEKLNSILADSNLMNKLMSTEIFRKMMNKAGGEQNGHK